MRCLSIADALKRQGQQVCFLTADENAAGLPVRPQGRVLRPQKEFRRLAALVQPGLGEDIVIDQQVCRKVPAAHVVQRTACLEYHVVSGAYNVHLAELKALERRHGNLRIYSKPRPSTTARSLLLYVRRSSLSPASSAMASAASAAMASPCRR